MQIAVYSRFLKPEDSPYVQALFNSLETEGIQAFVFQDFYQSFHGQIKLENRPPLFKNCEDLRQLQPDFLVTLGGDGTILDAVTLVRDVDLPIMGINLGRLGFLAMVEKNHILKAIQALKRSDYTYDHRTLLYLESQSPIFGDLNFALNDFTVLKRDTSSMVIIHTYINGEFLNSYWADGIIVATPTGSTGYSLSCGGPIIFPNSGNFVITPVAPHNLNVRPIVISDDSIISFEVEGRAENFLCTLDSRYRPIKASSQLAVRKASFATTLIRLNDRNFLSTIREKLNWGIDARN